MHKNIVDDAALKFAQLQTRVIKSIKTEPEIGSSEDKSPHASFGFRFEAYTRTVWENTYINIVSLSAQPVASVVIHEASFAREISQM